MKTLLAFCLVLFSGLAFAAETIVADSSNAFVSAARDQQSSAGGRGENCQSGNVTCTSGRTLGCSSTVGDVTHGSECAQHTGSVGWVSCRTFDSTGLVTSSFYDECP